MVRRFRLIRRLQWLVRCAYLRSRRGRHRHIKLHRRRRRDCHFDLAAINACMNHVAAQELCARHAATFAPLRITLEPWVNLLRGRVMKFPGLLLAYTPANAPAVVVSAGEVPAVGTVVAPATGPAVGTVIAPANPAVGTVVSPATGPAVPTTVAPSPYNSCYPPTAGGVVQGHVAQPPPYAAAPTGAVVQAQVVAAAPMDRK